MRIGVLKRPGLSLSVVEALARTLCLTRAQSTAARTAQERLLPNSNTSQTRTSRQSPPTLPRVDRACPTRGAPPPHRHQSPNDSAENESQPEPERGEGGSIKRIEIAVAVEWCVATATRSRLTEHSCGRAGKRLKNEKRQHHFPPNTGEHTSPPL